MNTRFLRCVGVLFLMMGTGVGSWAANPKFGVDSASSEWFREWYQWGELPHYLDNGSEYVTWQTETTGQWAMPEGQVFSIQGNSWRWNKYYHNGFRVDSRFNEGGSLFQWNMLETSLDLDYERGRLWLRTDSVRDNHVTIRGNMGGIGGISPGTKEMINWFHESASERVLQPIDYRSHIVGAGQLEAGYGIPSKGGKTYYQHAYAHYGVRREIVMDAKGVCGTKDAPYWQVQLDGELPFVAGPWSMHYILNTRRRTDQYNEFTYSPDEQADLTEYSASLYWKKGDSFTTGLMYALSHSQAHKNDYERNLIDQDGEGMEPWYMSGKLHEVNWAVNWKRELLPWLTLRVDGYNSVCRFRPTDAQRSIRMYAQYMDSARTDYYDMTLSSGAFTAGILENEVRLDARKELLPWLSIKGGVAATLDGVLTRTNVLCMPSWEADVAVAFHPVKWFDAEILLGNYRTRYGWNMVTLLSADYMNADVRYVGSGNMAERWGGEYLRVDKGLQEPQYAVLDVPIRFTIADRHEIAVLTTARKHWNCQTIVYEEGTEGASARYRLTKQQPLKAAGVMYDTPFFLSNTIRYQYTGKYAYFSLSWQSYQMSGFSLVGNGPMANNVDALSYSMVKDNVTFNYDNNASPVRALGRLEQDRAYICRVQLGANITYNWGLSLNFHFKDGTPFYSFHTQETVNGQGDKDLVILPGDTRGINVSDGHFGKRKDAFFNLDLRLRYRGNINMGDQRPGVAGAVPFEVQLSGYNLYDFGTELHEYCFDQYMVEKTRCAMTLCIPRGLMLSFKVGLSQNRD